jgi:hypothetical protein
VGGDKLGKQIAREEDKDCEKEIVKIVGGVKEWREAGGGKRKGEVIGGRVEECRRGYWERFEERGGGVITG